MEPLVRLLAATALAGTALAGAAPGGAAAPLAFTEDRLELSGRLRANGSLVSQQGQAELTMLSEQGHLVLRHRSTGTVLWTAGGATQNGGAECVLTQDGNLVVASPGAAPLWSSGTAGGGGWRAVLLDDCDLVLYSRSWDRIWSTHTGGCVPANSAEATMLLSRMLNSDSRLDTSGRNQVEDTALVTALVATSISLALLCSFGALGWVFWRKRRRQKAPTPGPEPKAVVFQPPPRPVLPRAAEEAPGSLLPPVYWSHRTVGARGDFQSQVEATPEVHEAVEQLLDRTFKPVRTRDRAEARMPRRLRVTGVVRVEDSALWRRYAEERQRLRLRWLHRCTPLSAVSGELLTTSFGGDLCSDVNEAYLFHGTSTAAAVAISRDGFKLDLSGTVSGTLYGAGAYLAECSSKADEYARPGADGLQMLLLCRVVLGEVLHLTRGGGATHGLIAEAMRSGEYDSVLGDRKASVGTYREFVVYSDTKAYPEYLVTYSREY